MNHKKRSIVLCVGHHRKKRGAQNKYYGLSEWQLCSLFTSELEVELQSKGYSCITLYNHTLREKVAEINRLKYEVAIDIHMNAFDTTCYGHLCMYWHNSFFGARLAETLNNNIKVNRKRPLIHVKKPTERGAYFLRSTKCIALIVELCFIDNTIDLIRTVNNFTALRYSFLESLNTFFLRYSIPIIERGTNDVV